MDEYVFKCKYRYGYVRNYYKKKCQINNKLCYLQKNCPVRKMAKIAKYLTEYLLTNETKLITDSIELIGEIDYIKGEILET